MNVTFDPAKNEFNIAKHGVSLALAAELEWKALAYQPDTRRDYGELRMIGYAFDMERLYCVVFVDRPPGQPTERRIISLKKANSREVKRYATKD